MLHICVSKLSQYCLRYWLDVNRAPSHYMIKWWHIINQNIKNAFLRNFNQNTTIFIQENELENVVFKMSANLSQLHCVNTLRLKQNGRHFIDNIFKCIFFSENARISIKISLKFVPKGLINNIPTLVEIMAWCQTGNKPLSEAMMVTLLMVTLLHSVPMS